MSAPGGQGHREETRAKLAEALEPYTGSGNEWLLADVALDAAVQEFAKALRERGEWACGGFEKEAAEFLLREFGGQGHRG